MMKAHAWAAQERGARLTPFEYELPPLAAHDCVIRVDACGICHSDIHMMDDDWKLSRYPLVPGHEVVGEVLEVGSAVQHVERGQRVGVGWQRSACLSCASCLKGDENLCDQSRGLIVGGHGGFADILAVDSRFAFAIPAGISTRTAGPLLCGGVTVYSALHHAGMSSGQRIGVIGVGGLGHLAVQFASRLGNQVTVFTTSEDKARLAGELGAVDARVVPPRASPPALGRKLDLLLSTVPFAQDWNAYLDLLGPDGTLCFVAVPPGPLTISLSSLLGKRRRIMASPIGGRAIMARMLSLADRYHVEPMVEVFPIEEVNHALDAVRKNQVRYRAVVVPSA